MERTGSLPLIPRGEYPDKPPQTDRDTRGPVRRAVTELAEVLVRPPHQDAVVDMVNLFAETSGDLTVPGEWWKERQSKAAPGNGVDGSQSIVWLVSKAQTIYPQAPSIEVSSEEAAAMQGSLAAPQKELAQVVSQVPVAALAMTYGATEDEFAAFLREHKAVFAPSASAGRVLKSINDHDGVLIVPALHRKMRVAERFKVVEMHGRYFVVGYANRVVNFADFKALVTGFQYSRYAKAFSEAEERRKATGDYKGVMETGLRSAMFALSQESELLVRRDVKESAYKLMPLLPNLGALPSDAGLWSNDEAAMPPGFGKASLRYEGGTLTDPDRDLYTVYALQFDYNKIESRLILFQNDAYAKNEKRPWAGPETPHESVKASGYMLAVIDGIDKIEVMDPAGEEFSVKMASLMTICQQEQEKGRRLDVVLNIRTQDGAIHELRLTERGAKLTLLSPKPSMWHGASGAAFGVGPSVVADFDVYSYEGRKTGVRGTESGFPEHKLVTSCNDRIKAGPFIHEAGGVRGTAVQVFSGLGNLATLNPLPSWDRSLITSTVKKTLEVTMQGVYVFGSTVAVNAARQRSNNTLLGGAHPFNASGSGQLVAQTQTTIVATTVIAHNMLTLAVAKAMTVLPQQLVAVEGPGAQFFWNWLAPTVNECTRLLMNAGIQGRFGLQRLSLGDGIAIGVQAAGSGMLSLYFAGSGNPENHRVLSVLLDSFKFAFDLTTRTIGTTANVSLKAKGTGVTETVSRAGFRMDFSEAMLTRLGTRGADKLLANLLGHALDACGLVGPNAGAFDVQVSYEARVDNVVAWLLGAADELARQSALHVDERMAAYAENCNLLRKAAAWLESLKPQLNRALLWWGAPTDTGIEVKHLETTVVAIANVERHKDKPDSDNHTSAKKEFDQHVRTLRATYDDGLANARLLTRQQRQEKGLVYYSSEELSDKTQLRTEEMRAAQRDGKYLYPQRVGYDGQTYPAHAEPGQSAKLPLNMTTFTTEGQRVTLPRHRALMEDPGIESLRNLKGEDALPEIVVDKIMQAVIDYTVESQTLHYPLRYDLTGQEYLQPVVYGIHFSYNMIHKNGKPYDPIGAIYINLGAIRSTKFPGKTYRAATSDAAYHDKEPPKEARAPRGPLRFITTGDLVQTSEELSMTAMDKMANYFGRPIAAGMPKNRSSLLHIWQTTGINVSRVSDLVQAEIIMTPGAVFRVAYVDEAGIDELGSERLTGIQTYLVEVNTFEEFEVTDNPDLQGMKRQPSLEIKVRDSEPTTSHEVDEADSGDEHHAAPQKVKMNQSSGRLERWDDDAGRWASFSIKNYVTGKDTDPSWKPTKHVHWLYPYTWEGAPRAMKDAILAAILRNDPIVAHGLLDEAIKNAHHQHFRKEAGFFDMEAGKQFLAQLHETKAIAAGTIKPLLQQQANEPLDDTVMQWTAWLLASMLRTPIMLVHVDDMSLEDNRDEIKPGMLSVTSFDQTFDSVDIRVKTDGTPNPAVMIGVDKLGFYTIEVAGTIRARRVDKESGKTMRAFLHAYYRGSPRSSPGDYSERTDGGYKSYRPTESATRTVAELLPKLQQVAATDYIVLQEAIVQIAYGDRDAWVQVQTETKSLDSDQILIPENSGGDSQQLEPAVPQAAAAAATILEAGGLGDLGKISTLQGALGTCIEDKRVTDAHLQQLGLAVGAMPGEWDQPWSSLIISLHQQLSADHESLHADKLAEMIATTDIEAVFKRGALPDEDAIKLILQQLESKTHVPLAVSVYAATSQGLRLFAKYGQGTPVAVLYGYGETETFRAIYKRDTRAEANSLATQVIGGLQQGGEFELLKVVKPQPASPKEQEAHDEQYDAQLVAVGVMRLRIEQRRITDGLTIAVMKTLTDNHNDEVVAAVASEAEARKTGAQLPNHLKVIRDVAGLDVTLHIVAPSGDGLVAFDPIGTGPSVLALFFDPIRGFQPLVRRD